ncbi:hypothetical protein NKR19_g207 [Coniochaeta hoffmannii]|uniref:Uncharacterized protein n=1 Tax=Coniochaeta hoffmannii TaxID=91930 RepID=A0AA38SEH0_9PEZI|nr:hypothetical protein NKR19_g207 [Coniochaeta hoffmannii]
MNSHAERTCLRDLASFRPKSGHRSLEAWVKEGAEPSSPTITEAPLDEANIPAWLEKPNVDERKGRVLFRLLLCAPREEYSELVLPIKPTTYETIAKAWGFPPMVLCSIRQPYSTAAYFQPLNDEGRPSHSLSSPPLARLAC